MASIETKLERLNKEELIALIWRMIERHADLELLVELAATDTQQSVRERRTRRRNLPAPLPRDGPLERPDHASPRT